MFACCNCSLVSSGGHTVTPFLTTDCGLEPSCGKIGYNVSSVIEWDGPPATETIHPSCTRINVLPPPSTAMQRGMYRPRGISVDCDEKMFPMVQIGRAHA